MTYNKSREFKLVCLGEVVNLKRGYDLPKKNRINGKIPVIGSSGIVGYHNVEKVKGPGVTTGRSGQLGNVYYSDNSFWPLNTSLYVENFMGNNPKFIYYLLQTVDFKQINAGSSVPTLNRNHAHKLEVKIPSKEYQEKIANILSSFDDKIEINNAIIANLEEQAQTIFKSWFVDFEPFKDSEFINSSMGKIPITCKVSKLKNLSTSMFNGGTPRRNNEDYWINGKIPWLKTKEINNNFIIETEEYITDKGLNESSAKLIRDRSVVVALYGATAGELGFIGKDMTANQACCAIESDYQSYIYYYLKNNQSYIKTLATGSAQQNLSKSTLENLDVLYPEKDYLDRFEKMARSFIEKSIYLELENKKLEETRDILLPKLMSGEIRVEDTIEVKEM